MLITKKYAIPTYRSLNGFILQNGRKYLSFQKSYKSYSIIHCNAHESHISQFPSYILSHTRFYHNSGMLPFISNLFLNRRLKKLEIEANRVPNDATKQASFLNALVDTGNYHLVIQRFEKGPFARNEDTMSAYCTALSKTNQLIKLFPNQISSSTKPFTVSNYISNSQGQSIPFNNSSQSIPFNSSSQSIPFNNSSQSIPFNNSSQSIPFNNSSQSIPFNNSSQSIPFNNSSIPFNDTSSGEKGNPIHVIVQPSGIIKIYQTAKVIGMIIFYGTILTAILTMYNDNPGLLRDSILDIEYEPSKSMVKFSDVHGVDEAKQELEDVVEFLRNPSKFTSLGGKLPKGVLLTGPPGTGKTMLARAVAGEAEVPFFFMSGSEFDEMFVGVGARRVRDLFSTARKKAPSIVFIDELDAIGSKRNPKDQSYVRQTLNQLLVDLDGFSQTEGVIFIAATNFPQSLDKALLRPGRFDRIVNVPLPDVRGRDQILKHYMQDIKFDQDLDISIVSRGTPGFSGADLKNLVNLAALQASKEKSKSVTLKHLDFAKDRLLMGAERKSAVITEESKKLTAYHEAGHALTAWYTPSAMPLHKVTCIPRGNSLGMTVQIPDMDKNSFTMKEYLAMIDVCMGGRVAEDIIFGKQNITSGAHNDIAKATYIAKHMVTQFGMSDKVGPVAHIDEELPHLSTQTKIIIENEMKSILLESHERTHQILSKHKDELHRLANALFEQETLDKDQILAVIQGNYIHHKVNDNINISNEEKIKSKQGEGNKSKKGNNLIPTPN